MAVTLGLMFRVDSAPPAVVIPPQTQSASFNHHLVIDAESIKPASASLASSALNQRAQSRTGELLMDNKAQQPLTYNQKGASQLPPVGGQLLDTYA